MTDRAHQINGALIILAIIAGTAWLSSHPEPSTERKLGPMPWEEGFKRQ